MSVLPPTIQLLLNEGLHGLDSPRELRDRIGRSGLFKEIKTQAEYCQQHWDYIDTVERQRPARLVVTSSGSLNPLSSESKCASLGCRIDTSRLFTNTLGLYADHCIIPDSFTELFTRADKASPDLASELFKNLKVLYGLMPLVESGHIEFAAPRHGLCNKCDSTLASSASDSLEKILDIATSEIHSIKMQRKGSEYVAWIRFSDGFAGISPGLPIKRRQAYQIESLPKTRGSAWKRETAFLRPGLAGFFKALLGPSAASIRSAAKTGSILGSQLRSETLFLNGLEGRPCPESCGNSSA